MGFFDKLFGANRGEHKKANHKRSKNRVNQNTFISNAEEYGFGQLDLAISGKLRVDGLSAMMLFEQIAKERKEKFDFAVMYTSLLEEGALTVPVVCTVGSKKYSLYFIYREEDLLKYKDLVKQVTRTSYPNLIYFSSIPISEPFNPKPIIEPFQLADLRHDAQAVVAGTFAMWQSTKADPYFHTSKTYEYLSKFYELVQGYESYMTGYVLRQTRIVNELELKRIALPLEPVSYILDAPEQQKVILNLSQEKGIRFLFNINTTSPEYRERFIKGAVVDFIANVIPLRKGNFPPDEPLEPNAHEWFTFITKVVKSKEKSGEMKDHHIGTIQINSQFN